jgi:cytochrome P450
MGRLALLGDLIRRRGRSMLNLLPAAAYRVQMGVGRLSTEKIFLVNAPETVKEVMVNCPHLFPKHHFFVDILEPLIGASSFNTNGEQWKKQRPRVDQAFKVTRMRQVFPLMLLAVEDLLRRLKSQMNGGMTGSNASIVVDMGKHMGHVTSDIIFRTLFSTAFQSQTAVMVYQELEKYQLCAQRVMGLGAFHLPAFWHRYRCRVHGRAIRQAFAPLVQERFVKHASGDTLPSDMVTALMLAVDPDSGERFSETEVIDQVALLFIAGHETSASILTWALYLLARCPDLQTALRQEVNSLCADRDPQYGDIRQLSGVQNLLKETLRLYPPIPFYVRRAASETCLRDKPVPKDSMVVVSAWVIHRHEALWDDPDAFKPQRFEETSASTQNYLPFGLGERACPGAAFATQESVLVLAKMIQTFSIELADDNEPQPVARLTLRPAQPLRLRLRVLNQVVRDR